MVNILSFDEAINQSTKESSLKDNKPTILLGNGFSMSLFPDIFSYQSLLQMARDAGLFNESPNVLKLFENTRTYDFEMIINLLCNTSIVLPQYTAHDYDLIAKIKDDAGKLKQILVETITRNHPESPSEISDEQYENCKNFISKFKSVFTLNYDLLLYWVVIKYLPEIKFVDGFDDLRSGDGEDYVREKYVSWNNDSGHSITLGYLHGALHLYDAKYELRKHCFSRTGERLKNQILNAMDGDSFPLFVAEGDARSKETRIYNNGYLSKVMRSFRETSGDLFIYGFGFKDNDQHLVERIVNSKIQNLYVGVRSQKSCQLLLPSLELIKERRSLLVEKGKRNHQLHIYYYSTETAAVWNKHK